MEHLFTSSITFARNFWNISAYQLIENGYIAGVREKGSIALRGGGERRSVHTGEDVGKRAGRTEICPGPSVAGKPLALRRVYRSDILISQLRERHGSQEEVKSAAVTQSNGIASISTFRLQCEHVGNKRCTRDKSIFPLERPV